MLSKGGEFVEPLERQRLAHTLRQLRVGRGLRQIDLAIPGRLSRSAISALERGQIANPSRQLIMAVAKALEVRYDDLLQFSDGEASVLALLEKAHRLMRSVPKKSLRAAQRALIHSRRLLLYDMEREAIAVLATWYAQSGDPFRASVYAGWNLTGPNRENSLLPATVIAFGERLQELGEWEAAIALYRLYSIGIHPATLVLAGVFLRLGQTYMDVHRYPQALRMLVRAQRDGIALGNPEITGPALVSLSRSLGFTGRHAEAEQARLQASMLAATDHWTDLQDTVLRTGEILAVLSSSSLSDARGQWKRATHLVQTTVAPIQDQVNLLHSWIYYASRHEAWGEVILAAESGLELMRSTANFPNRGMKGQLLWSRAQANQALGRPWEHDAEWATDLLGRKPIPEGR